MLRIISRKNLFEIKNDLGTMLVLKDNPLLWKIIGQEIRIFFRKKDINNKRR